MVLYKEKQLKYVWFFLWFPIGLLFIVLLFNQPATVQDPIYSYGNTELWTVPVPNSTKSFFVDYHTEFNKFIQPLLKDGYSIAGPVPGTGSMRPTLYVNNRLIVKQKPNVKDLMVGNIIGVRSEGYNVLHRIVQVGYDPEWYAILKGDNNAVPDPYRVRAGDVSYVVVAIIY